MDLLTSSGSSVTAAVAGKAVGTWAARRLFGGVDNGRLAVSMGTVGRGGRIRRSHRRSDTSYIFSLRDNGAGGLESDRGGRKSVHNVAVDRDDG